MKMILKFLSKLGDVVVWSFVVLGLAVLTYFAGGRDIYLWAASKQWIETTCVVEYAALDSQTDSDGDEGYRVSTAYSFKDEADYFRGTRYAFNGFDWYSSNYVAPSRAVKYLKRNAAAVPCYYNPRNPDQSVIDRRFQTETLFVLVPGTILLILLFGFIHTTWFYKKPADD